MEPETKLKSLLDIMARLRDPEGGCPWDLEQDFSSISPHTIEEAYEVDEAIAKGDLVGFLLGVLVGIFIPVLAASRRRRWGVCWAGWDGDLKIIPGGSPNL